LGRNEQSFDWDGDELLDGRKKLIHTVGTVAKTEFISTGDHSYTGVFKGCQNVLLRPSIAHTQDISKSTAEGAHDNFVPGFSIKFLRDGASSANVQAMFSLDGQKSWNFFKNDFANHVGATSSFALRLLGLKFSTVTDYIQTIGLKDLAVVECNGQKSMSPKYPFMLIFKPNETMRNKFPDNYEQDYLEQLKSVEVGSELYDVYALDQPESHPTKIGTLKTTSKMVTSHWGDESLFFKHNHMEIDLKENPSWEAYIPKYHFFGSQEGKKCPYL